MSSTPFSMGFFTKIFCRLFAWIPRDGVRFFGSLIGVLWFDIFRLRRKIVLDNLKIAFPEQSEEWRTHQGRQSIMKMGANALELFTLPSLDEKWIAKNAVIHNWERLEQAKAKGQGVFLLSLHMGAYDIAASLMSMRGQETYLISKFFKNKFLNDLWFSIRSSQGMKFIDPHGRTNAFDILKALKSNAGVIFVTDQFMGKPFGVESTFFGRRTGTAKGLGLFVIKTGAPVVPVYSVTGDDGKLHLIFEPEIETASLIDEDKEKSIARLTERFNRELETIIRKYPNEWLWVHRRWKDYE